MVDLTEVGSMRTRLRPSDKVVVDDRAFTVRRIDNHEGRPRVRFTVALPTGKLQQHVAHENEPLQLTPAVTIMVPDASKQSSVVAVVKAPKSMKIAVIR